jgi:ParB family chromosome partitioning protein
MNTRKSKSNRPIDSHGAARSNDAVITGAARKPSNRSGVPSTGSLRGPRTPRPAARTRHANEILVDARSIKPSPWANRLEASYLHAEFLELKRSIAADGGNTVPIKVRRVATRSSGKGQQTYEVVYGHRRHRACLELGLPVRVIVQDLSDEELVAQMHAENLHRRDLSAYERGLAYEKMLARGLYKNPAELARRLRVDAGDLSRVRFLATLPSEILDLVQSPLDLAVHDADKLRSALSAHRDEVMRRVAEIANQDGILPARLVVKKLSDFSPKPADEPPTREVHSIEIDGQPCAQITQDALARPTVVWSIPFMPADIDDFQELVRRFARKLLGKRRPKEARARAMGRAQGGQSKSLPRR